MGKQDIITVCGIYTSNDAFKFEAPQDWDIGEGGDLRLTDNEGNRHYFSSAWHWYIESKKAKNAGASR